MGKKKKEKKTSLLVLKIFNAFKKFALPPLILL
jgi:hypothetical protein